MLGKSNKFLVAAFIAAMFCSVSIAEVSKCSVGGKCAKKGELWYKARMTHYWQGALNGVDTKNSDRINGVYDLDFCYLLDYDESAGEDADYVLLNVSTQMSFGYGVGTSKLGQVGGSFNNNYGALGDLDYYVDKCFVEFTMLDRELTFAVGKVLSHDYFDNSWVANSEFTQFMSPQLTNNCAVPWPSKGIGAIGRWSKNDRFYVQAGIMDAQAEKRETGLNTAFRDEDYWFSIAEAGYNPKICGLDGMYRFIMWYDPQDKAYLDGSGLNKRDDLGFAVSFDQNIDDKTTLFFRYGWADDKVNRVKGTISFGGQIKGPFQGRECDVLGIGYADNSLSGKGLAANRTDDARILEAYYSCKVNKNTWLTPSIQVVFDPGSDESESAATVFGVRLVNKF